jgi:hypothetical protein
MAAALVLLANGLGFIDLALWQFWTMVAIGGGGLWVSYRRGGRTSGTHARFQLLQGQLTPFVKDLDAPLLKLADDAYFSLRDACSGLHAFGAIGSGKTSGLGKMILGAFLRAGFGGIITAVKPDAVEEAIRAAAAHGRSKSLILFDENEGFNFLAYLMDRHGLEGIGTVTEALMHVVEASKKASASASQRGGDAFWADSARQAIRRAILALYAAKGSVSVAELVRFINTAPASIKDVTDPDWQKRSYMYAVMDAATRRPKVPLPADVLADVINNWAETFPAIPDKTRGNIVITITSALDRFLHGRLARAFCGRTTIVPEMTFHGAVIVLAMPTLTWNEDGVVAQVIFKYIFLREALARNSLAPKHRERPIFCYCDEAQETVHPYDGDALSVGRSSKLCPVSMTQSLLAYYSRIGGDNPRDAAHALAGRYLTHVYFTNACPETNDFASRMIGRVVRRRGNYSSGTSASFNVGMNAGESENSGFSSNFGASSSSGFGQGSHNSSAGSSRGDGTSWGENRGRGQSHNVSEGYSENMEFAIEPGDFARRLKTGGRQNGNEVTGVWFQGGRIFRNTGTNHFVARFRQ